MKKIDRFYRIFRTGYNRTRFRSMDEIISHYNRGNPRIVKVTSEIKNSDSYYLHELYKDIDL